MAKLTTPGYLKYANMSCRPPDYSELQQRLEALDAENRRLMTSHGKLIQETNKRIQAHVNENKALKTANGRLTEENLELRDLCCFLDDDRQRTKRLSREWQRFGRYTAGIMKQEVSAYQEKLSFLERRQENFMLENTELKQLCVYLDDNRRSDKGSPESGCSVRCSVCNAGLTNRSVDETEVATLKCQVSPAGSPSSSGNSSMLSLEQQPNCIAPANGISNGHSVAEEMCEVKRLPQDWRGRFSGHSSTSKTGEENGHRDSPPPRFEGQHCSHLVAEGDSRPPIMETLTQRGDKSSADQPLEPSFDNNAYNNQLMAYISTLESRIQQLEQQLGGCQLRSSLSHSTPNIASDAEQQDPAPMMVTSNTSSRSAGVSTVYASSESMSSRSESPITALHITSSDGEDGDLFPDEMTVSRSLTTAALAPIEEEEEDNEHEPLEGYSGEAVTSKLRPLKDTVFLSYSEPVNLHSTLSCTSEQNLSGPLYRHQSMVICGEDDAAFESSAGHTSSGGTYTSVAAQGTSLSEALQVLQIQESIANKQQAPGTLTDTERAILQQMCKVAWKTIDDDSVAGKRRLSSSAMMMSTTAF